MRRGQGLPVNLIIIVAIGLLVLVILAVLVAKSSRNVDQNASKSCASAGGLCRLATTGCQSGEQQENYACAQSQGQDQICCIYNFAG